MKKKTISSPKDNKIDKQIAAMKEPVNSVNFYFRPEYSTYAMYIKNRHWMIISAINVSLVTIAIFELALIESQKPSHAASSVVERLSSIYYLIIIGMLI